MIKLSKLIKIYNRKLILKYYKILYEKFLDIYYWI